MPEGPEVKRMAMDLSKFLAGKQISNAEILSGRYLKKPVSGWDSFIDSLPSKITAVGVHGKFMYIVCSTGHSIWSTLGMTGRWTANPGKHSRVKFTFSEHGDCVFFDDTRNFGTMKIAYGRKKLLDKINSLGPDMLSSDLSNLQFIEAVRRKQGWNICKVIMNQSIISGVGNYIKSEALWISRISPERIVSSISDEELSALNSSIKQVMRDSYISGGATFLTYKDFSGESGDYSSRFLCYGRSIDPDGKKIIKTKTPDGRTTHWAPQRQR